MKTLRALVHARVRQTERRLGSKGMSIGCGDYAFTEVMSRGKQRFDLLLHKHGERMVCTDVEASDTNGTETETGSAYRVLEALALDEGSWVPTVKAVLGEGFSWEAAAVCSRPGARAEGWHAEPHTRYSFGGESGSALSLLSLIHI